MGDAETAVAPPPADPTSSANGGVLKLAVLAVGGQGGGVLTNWITDLAHRAGWHAQATSVAGVAQRTGSTIYYVEMAPRSARGAPVFALSPAPGDVDVLVAAELMEAGRALARGFVTPDRTVLVASTHRVLATVEKIVPGDGRSPAEPVLRELREAAHRTVLDDLETVAARHGTVISASLFGALLRSDALPFPRALWEDTIRASGRGVERSLAAFRAAANGERPSGAAGGGEGRRRDAPLVAAGAPEPKPDLPALPHGSPPHGPPALVKEWQALLARCDALPAPDMARRGLRKVVDYQDTLYGRLYLDRLERLPRDPPFAEAAAKHLANAMCYDDLIRVADLKTRPARDRRVRLEHGAEREVSDRVLRVTEYFHPRAPEVAGAMPVRLGRWLEADPRRLALLARLVDRGRRVRTDRVGGFLLLWTLAALRPWRRRLLRHAREEAHLEAWLALAERTHASDPALAAEILRCRRLIKGYSDTHARGLSKYDRVLAAVPLLQGRDDAADWLRRLREAALKDAEGTALDGALQTVRSFADERHG